MWLQMIKFALKCCVVVWIFVLLVSCDDRIKELQEGRVVAVQTAPDGLSKAFVWLPELGGLGATVSQPYQVWMQKGEKQRALIFEADKTDGVRLAWKSPSELAVCYQHAQITHFINFFVVAEQDSWQIYEVEIVLRKVQKLSDC
jgi:hypothetical protein